MKMCCVPGSSKPTSGREALPGNGCLKVRISEPTGDWCTGLFNLELRRSRKHRNQQAFAVYLETEACENRKPCTLSNGEISKRLFLPPAAFVAKKTSYPGCSWPPNKALSRTATERTPAQASKPSVSIIPLQKPAWRGFASRDGHHLLAPCFPASL